jgi:hypothetical protein
MFATGDYQLASNLMVSALYMHAREPLDVSAGQAADFLSLGSRLSLADGMSIGMSYGLLREDGQLLGLQSDGALALGDVGMTQLGGLNFNAQMDARTSLSAFAEASVTSATQAEGSMFTAPSNWVGSRMGLAISRNGVLQAGDVVTLSMIKPWQLVDGQVEARVAVGREFDGSVTYESRSVELGTAAIPLDIGFSYVKAGGVVGYGGSIWLRDGDARSLGLDEVSVAASMSVRF